MNATTTVSVGQAFDAVYAQVTPIAYNAGWENGTGYFDNAVAGEAAPVLKPGQIASSVSPAGRKILFIGTVVGNVVLFKRYNNIDDLIAWHASSVMYEFIGDKAENKISIDAFEYIVGNGVDTPNINTHFNNSDAKEREESISYFNARMAKYGCAGH